MIRAETDPCLLFGRLIYKKALNYGIGQSVKKKGREAVASRPELLFR